VRLGAIAVAVNTRYRAVEVADIVARSGAKVLACAPGFRRIDLAYFVGQAAGFGKMPRVRRAGAHASLLRRR